MKRGLVLGLLVGIFMFSLVGGVFAAMEPSEYNPINEDAANILSGRIKEVSTLGDAGSFNTTGCFENRMFVVGIVEVFKSEDGLEVGGDINVEFVHQVVPIVEKCAVVGGRFADVQAGDAVKIYVNKSGENYAFVVGGYSLEPTILDDAECTIDSDCYPDDFEPADCGNFYNCAEGACIVGSTACANDTDDNNDSEKPDKLKCDGLAMKRCRLRKNCYYNPLDEKCYDLNIDDIKNRFRDKIGKVVKPHVAEYLDSLECPENCKCTGSVIKCETANGREMTIIAGRSGNVIFQVKGVNATTRVEIIRNGSEFIGNFSGRMKRIKIMPDQVKNKTLKRLKMKNCTECDVELLEDGSYEMKTKRKYRVFGIFPAKKTIVTRIDSESGEIISEKRPWWRIISWKSSK
ncbi:hypothetical protein GOV14_06105 [Candidatus Pacearchaeota archaeon]|nr:hypothetical protein [Candidatus Pacearchaeota archaeon]